VGESFDHGPPGWIRQSRKRCTQFIHNRMVVDYLSMSSGDFAIPWITRICFTIGSEHLGVMRLNYWFSLVLILVSIFFPTERAHAVEQIVQLTLQRAECLCGIVTYINGDTVPDALVEEFAEEWKGNPLRSAMTDSEGRFTLTPVKGRKIYYLQISLRRPGVNPLRVPVQINRIHGTKLLRLQLHLA